MSAWWFIMMQVAAASAPAPYDPDRTLFEVRTFDEVWTDGARARAVPVRVFLPAGPGPFPVVIVSHGLGGSRESYAYLGQHLAARGYVCVHLQHAGSDAEVWRGKAHPFLELGRAARDIRAALARPADVRFAIDRLTELAQTDHSLGGKLDLSRIGVAGHSYGAWTALSVAGEVFENPLDGQVVSLADTRVRAAVAMSAPVSLRTRRMLERAFGAITIPVLHLTGTKDESPLGETRAAQRRLPFDHSLRSDRILITFQGADHFVFSGRLWRMKRAGARDGHFQDLTRAACAAFFDAMLRQDAAAQEYLWGKGLASRMGADAVVERARAQEPAAAVKDPSASGETAGAGTPGPSR